MKKADLDLYTDYLLSTFGAATATGLSAMVDGDVKLECLGIANKLNSFALCRNLLINASRSAYAQLQLFRAAA